MAKEYIDREALIKDFTDGLFLDITSISDTIDFLSSYPAADVAPVVHGRWLCGQTVAWHTRYSCSVCGRSIEICVEDKKDGLHQYPYCHCGAKMDGGTEDG